MVSFVQDGTTYKETSSQSPQRPFVIVRNPLWVFFVLDILFDVEIPRFPIPLFLYCITICRPALRSEFNSNPFPGIHKQAVNSCWFGLNNTSLTYARRLSPSSIITGVSKKELRAAESNGIHCLLTLTCFGDLSSGSYTFL